MLPLAARSPSVASAGLASSSSKFAAALAGGAAPEDADSGLPADCAEVLQWVRSRVSAREMRHCLAARAARGATRALGLRLCGRALRVYGAHPAAAARVRCAL